MTLNYEVSFNRIQLVQAKNVAKNTFLLIWQWRISIALVLRFDLDDYLDSCYTIKHSSRVPPTCANRTCFNIHQMSALMGGGGPEANRVSSEGHHMLLAEGVPVQWGLMSIGGIGHRILRSSASWVMVTWDPLVHRQTDTTENITLRHLPLLAVNIIYNAITKKLSILSL